MNTIKTSQRYKAFVKFAPLIILFCFTVSCVAQGTLTFTFEGQPSGTSSQAGPYDERDMRFRSVPVGTLYLSGGGVAGYPDNGTGYLYAPDNGIWFQFIQTLPFVLFNLVSFDAARVGPLPPPTIQVVGYKPMAGTVTNFFTLSAGGPDFQTFYLDSSFVNLFRVDMYARFSLDNLVISGVPEPSSGALVVLGIGSALGWSRMRRKFSR